MKKTINQTSDKKDFGTKGEESAASFLCGKGFKIIERNIRLGHSEIDIVAKNEKYIVFAEVKTRRTYPDAHNGFGRPAAAVNFKKRLKLYEGAAKYMKKNKEFCDGLQPRIDVLEVYVSPNSEKYKVLKIIHMPNAVVGGKI